jgi:hypothetical protein
MTTKQTDAVAMTEQQLDTVVGGAAFIKYDGVQDGVLRMDKSSTKMRLDNWSPKSRFSGYVPETDHFLPWHRG